MTSPQQPSTVEQIADQYTPCMCAFRLGFAYKRGMPCKCEHDKLIAAINELRRQDMEYVIGKKFDVNQYLVKYGDGEIAYHLGEASVSVTDVLKLRADQRKRLEERLNEPE